MPKEAELRRLLDEDDLIRWREATMTADKETVEVVPEAPSNPLCFARQPVTTIKAATQQQGERKQSLLTKALQPGQEENGRPQIYMSTQMERHRSTRSTRSNGSTTSTVDLISDSGLTSPTRTSTPSPPFPNNHTYTTFAPYTLGPKLAKAAHIQSQQPRPPAVETRSETTTLPQPDASLEALVKKRCISFACGKPEKPTKPVEERVTEKKAEEPAAPPKPKRISFACAAPPKKATEEAFVEVKPAEPESPKKRTISFACNVPKIEAKAVTLAPEVKASPALIHTAPLKTAERLGSRSPSMSRKPRSSTPGNKGHRDSTSTIRRASQSPEAVRTRKPKFISADNDDLESSEARFHEFASDEPQDDDWIRKDTSDFKVKITISDTLKKETAIRQLAQEAEEEDMEDGEDEDDEDDEENEDDEDDEDDDEDDDDETDGDDEDIEEGEENHIRLHASDSMEGSIDYIDSDASDGNESDNEAGFADSDDDNDPLGEYAFWTPGKLLFASSGEANTFRPSLRHRVPSESSIDSLSHMSPVDGVKGGKKSNRMKPSRKIRIRPGTPDLPDSTDFVCGTLDEDRPLEEAYISCMEARRRQKHHLIPQDIDPSFPTSDPEDEEDEVDDIETKDESDDAVWLHGKFEDSDSDGRQRRRQRKSPKHSPKRLHSPPPPTKHRSPPPTTRRRSPPPTKHGRRSPPTSTRHHSPPPRRLFMNSPRAIRPHPSGVNMHSPVSSFTNHASTSVIFAPLGIRPGLTHTKSLPRRSVGFTQQYRASRLSGAISEEEDENDDRHTRGAIDIVKGLEQKRERRKEKFYSKLCAKARKAGGNGERRRPMPGKGAERMKELGLQMAGKTGQEQMGPARSGKAEFVLSV